MKIRTPLVTVVLTVGALAGAARIVYRSARAGEAQLHPPRQPVIRPADPAALPGLTDVTFSASDGVVLKGWYVPSRNRAAVVLVHGVGENRAQLLFEARALSRAGYGVLLYDSRGHGESGGDACTWGDRERLDLTAALDFLSHRPDVDPARLGAVGFSMGGAVVLLVAEQDPRIKAVVAAGVYASIEAEVGWNYRRYGPLSVRPALWAMAHNGVHIDEVRPIDALCRIAPRPLLFIAGTEDPYAPLPELERQFHAACEPKQLWKIQGAGHGGYDKVAGAEYSRRLVAFFDGALSGRP